DLNGEGVVELKTPQVVHDRELILRDVIDTRQVGEPVEFERRRLSEELGDRPPIRDLDVHARVLVLGECGEDLFAELLAEELDDLRRGHSAGEYRATRRWPHVGACRYRTNMSG